MAMAKAAKESGTLLIVPNAGADAVTGAMCAPNIFRSSFSNWQPGYAMGEVMAKKGIKKVVTITWKYGAGDESVKGFKESFEKGGGTVVKELSLPFPNVEFQGLLTEIAATKPDAVFTFFAGGGAVKFVKDYAAAGLKGTIPLYGSGFLTDGNLDAEGAAAAGGHAGRADAVHSPPQAAKCPAGVAKRANGLHPGCGRRLASGCRQDPRSGQARRSAVRSRGEDEAREPDDARRFR
jgi:ABC-type branched-subunit amino acid transport system substrate-binding protein